MVFDGRKLPNVKVPTGRKLGEQIPQAPLSSHVPISCWFLPMAEPKQKPERPECPLISEAAHRADWT